LHGAVQTVRGPVPADSLGRTLAHEHLLIDRAQPQGDCGAPSGPHVLDPIRLDNYYEIRRDHANLEDLRLTSVADAIAEIAPLRSTGIGTVVDVTPAGIGRDPLGPLAIARATDVNVVMGCGFYVDRFHPRGLDELGEDAILNVILADVTDGVAPTGIRAGVIGEIGLGWPPSAGEVAVLRAAARAQRASDVALVIHPGRDPAAPFECLDIVVSAGGDPARCVISHVDRTLFNLRDMCRLAATSCFLSFDLFGVESSYYAPAPIDMPNDAARIDRIRQLFTAGFERSILISQDICVKTRLARYGGEGYTHISRRVVPLFRRKGFSEEELDLLLVHNPAIMLTGRPAGEF
jgi:phosphotriesterase-related protein